MNANITSRIRYVVCEYYPPGNVIGQFEKNVQRQIKGGGQRIQGGKSEGRDLQPPFGSALSLTVMSLMVYILIS